MSDKRNVSLLPLGAGPGARADEAPTGVRRLARSIGLLIAALVGWATSPAAAWAQGSPPPDGRGASWAVSYALAILGIALGLMIVLQPSRRRDRPQIDQFDD